MADLQSDQRGARWDPALEAADAISSRRCAPTTPPSRSAFYPSLHLNRPGLSALATGKRAIMPSARSRAWTRSATIATRRPSAGITRVADASRRPERPHEADLSAQTAAATRTAPSWRWSKRAPRPGEADAGAASAAPPPARPSLRPRSRAPRARDRRGWTHRGTRGRGGAPRRRRRLLRHAPTPRGGAPSPARAPPRRLQDPPARPRRRAPRAAPRRTHARRRRGRAPRRASRATRSARSPLRRPRPSRRGLRPRRASARTQRTTPAPAPLRRGPPATDRRGGTPCSRRCARHGALAQRGEASPGRRARAAPSRDRAPTRSNARRARSRRRTRSRREGELTTAYHATVKEIG